MSVRSFAESVMDRKGARCLCEGDDAWWRTAVVYEIYIRSFADHNGDGIGDIDGIRSRLPYLRSLGVDAIWITPWYASPMADGGYDVADYCSIAPEFGTISDAERLIEDAHHLGLRVIIDFVPNHTSIEHPWFKELLKDPGNEQAASRYWVRPGRGPEGREPPNNWRSVFGGPAWSPMPRHPGTRQLWYLHLFAPAQADLNWQNEEVRRFFDAVIRFWFYMGVDGLRIDVAHGLSKDPLLPDLRSEAALSVPTSRILDEGDEKGAAVEQHPFWDRDDIHDVFERWRAIADSYAATPQGKRMFVAEAWRIRPGGLHRYVRPKELNLAFNFDFLNCAWSASAIRESIDQHLMMLAAVVAPATWVLSSHDFIRPASRLGYAGEWRELRSDATRLGGDYGVGLLRARAAALLALALPGSAYIYQGDELGLPEVLDIPSEDRRDPIWSATGGAARGRDGCRVPLPWSPDGPSYGFGEQRGWLPQPSCWSKLAVDTQMAQLASTLMLYRQAIALRPSIQRAASTHGLNWNATDNKFLMFHYGDSFACAVNFSVSDGDLPEGWAPILSSTPLESFRLPPHSTVWLVRREGIRDD